MEDSLKKHIEFYELFEDKTRAVKDEARTRRNYVNNIQWTEDERAELNRRKQPIITDNRIKRKTDYWLGVERQTRTDPKAFPRTPQHEEASDAFTDALRYVCDNNDWDIERSEAFDTLIVEGIEGYSIPVKKLPNGEIEIRVHHIPYERAIYDTNSTDRFFRDSKKKGIKTWMDEDDAKAMFKGKDDVIDQAIAMGNEDDDDEFSTNEKPRAVWSDKQARRLKVIQLYYLERGQWMHCIYTKAGYLQDPEPSKYLDEYGQPDCPIEFGGAYIDKDNDRFGLVQDMISLQDMVNKMQSKYMHFMNSNQTWGNEQGPNANEAKKQARLPDGHFALKGGAKYGEHFGIVQNDNKAMAAFNILQQAQLSLAEIGGNSLVDDMASGRSKEVTAQTKMIELGPVLDTHRQLSKRVYKQMWNRIKQFKTAEWWVRVTDDENNLKFVGINQPITYAQALQEKFGGIPPQVANDPRLNMVREVRNNVAEIDVDIIVEEAPDVVNIQQEQFQILAKLAQAYGPQEVPFEKVLRLSQLRNKEQFLEQTKGSEQQRQQQAQIAQRQQQEAEQILKAEKISKIEETKSKTVLNKAKAQETTQKAEKQDIENELTTQQVQLALQV